MTTLWLRRSTRCSRSSRSATVATGRAFTTSRSRRRVHRLVQLPTPARRNRADRPSSAKPTAPITTPCRQPSARHYRASTERGTGQLARLRRYGLIIIEEVGYLPIEQDAANLFFQLVSSRYEHASLILTSNLPFSGWGGVFGDQAVAAAMTARVVHHADVLTLKGASYRLRNRGSDTLPSIKTQDTATENTRTGGLVFERRIGLTSERCRQTGCPWPNRLP